jgi:hypothetical protein
MATIVDDETFYDPPNEGDVTDRENDLKNFQKTIDTFSKKYNERLNNNKILQDEVENLSEKNKNIQEELEKCTSGKAVPIVDPKFAKYEKMLKMLPEGAVRQKMKQDGIVDSDIEKFFSSRGNIVVNTSATSEESQSVKPNIAVTPKDVIPAPPKGSFWESVDPMYSYPKDVKEVKDVKTVPTETKPEETKKVEQKFEVSEQKLITEMNNYISNNIKSLTKILFPTDSKDLGKNYIQTYEFLYECILNQSNIEDMIRKKNNDEKVIKDVKVKIADMIIPAINDIINKIQKLKEKDSIDFNPLKYPADGKNLIMLNIVDDFYKFFTDPKKQVGDCIKINDLRKPPPKATSYLYLKTELENTVTTCEVIKTNLDDIGILFKNMVNYYERNRTKKTGYQKISDIKNTVLDSDKKRFMCNFNDMSKGNSNITNEKITNMVNSITTLNDIHYESLKSNMDEYVKDYKNYKLLVNLVSKTNDTELKNLYNENQKQFLVIYTKEYEDLNKLQRSMGAISKKINETFGENDNTKGDMIDLTVNTVISTCKQFKSCKHDGFRSRTKAPRRSKTKAPRRSKSRRRSRSIRKSPRRSKSRRRSRSTRKAPRRSKSRRRSRSTRKAPRRSKSRRRSSSTRKAPRRSKSRRRSSSRTKAPRRSKSRRRSKL